MHFLFSITSKAHTEVSLIKLIPTLGLENPISNPSNLNQCRTMANSTEKSDSCNTQNYKSTPSEIENKVGGVRVNNTRVQLLKMFLQE